MRTSLLKYATFLAIFSLFCAHSVWAEEDYQTVYFTALKARSSTASESTGTGKVQLTLVDIKGQQLNGLGANPNPTDISAAENGNAVTMLGGTLFATEGIEIPENLGNQIYATSYSYFKADAYPALGSYFVMWTYANRQITKLDTAMNKEIKPIGTYFKVLPDSTKNGGVKIGETLMMDAKAQKSVQYVMAHPDSICAVFKKYLLSNPSITNVQMNVQMNGTVGDTTIAISMDVEGDTNKLSIADFDVDNITFTNNDGENKKWKVQPDKAVKKTYPLNSQKATYIFPVTFTFQDGMSMGTTYRTTMTIKMAGDENSSMLQIPIAVTVLDPDRPQAILFDGKTKREKGDVSDLLNKIGSLEFKEQPIIQLHKGCGNLSLQDNNFTLDLNGNQTGEITISSGEVTIAYSKFGGKAGNVTVKKGGKLILNGGELASLTIAEGAEVEQNGATITGSVANRGTLTTTAGQILGGLTSSGTLTINGGSFAGENAITIEENGEAELKRGSINGTIYGVLITKGGTTTIEKLAAITGGKKSVMNDGGEVNVNCGKFGAPLAGNIIFTSGYFKDKNYGFDKSADMTELQLTTGVEYNEGYRYFLGTQDAAKKNGVGVCRIGETGYATLEDALAYANNNKDKEVIIFMTNNYTLPAGHYTLPAKATIVVPMSDSQSEVNMTVPRVAFNDADKSHPYIQPTEFRRLTLSEGVNMEVFGTIEMSGTQFSSNEPYTGQPYGPYGHLVMKKGSHMTLLSGSQLRAWGYMTGEGEIDARRDSKVREFFQMGDWKGAWTTVQLAGILSPNNEYVKAKVFPITQYFIQNIEVPVKYHPGAMLTTATTVSEGLEGVNIAMAANDIVIVGVTNRDSAIFVMDNEADAENTWVRKWYDTENDIQTYEVNNSAHIGSMVLDMGNLALGKIKAHVMLNSAKFDLPITSNMKIHLLSGEMDFMQNTSLLPGSEVEVDKKSTVYIHINLEDKEHTGALYVYDAKEWERYAYRESGENAYTKVVRYTPTSNGTPTKRNEDRCPGSAKINVHGTFKTDNGYVYTSGGGANIVSSNEDAGTFIFNQDASVAGTREVYQIIGTNNLDHQTFSSAQLMNGNAEHEVTTSAKAGDAYCYRDNYWTILHVDEDNECFMVDNHGSFYAKPAEYVKVVATKKDGDILGNTDHTYSDATGTGRLFILMDDCQWWEVEKKDNLYHCIHPDNDTYYEWNDDSGKWQETKYTITWKNWDGTIIKTKIVESGDEFETESYSVPYGTMAEFLGPNPTRDADIDYTYDFTGWTPALGKVTSDVTYTATYIRKPRKYTITFCNEGGSVIERQFLTHNEVPVCENVPTKIGHYLQWTPAIAAVTGDATYTATWLEEKPTKFEVRFVDYNGDELQKDSVTTGNMPKYNGADPTGKAKKAETDENKEFTYEFVGWSPAIHPVDAAITYTAVYEEVAQTYTITFQDENGTTIESNKYAYGVIPVCSKTPTEPNDADYAQYTYTFAWTPQIEAVRGLQNYQAQWSKTTNKYTVTLRSNNDAVCTFTGAGIYDYGTKVTIAANVAEGYEFVRWKERADNKSNLGEIEIKGDITLTAVVKTKGKKPSVLEVGVDKTTNVADLTDKEVMDLIITSKGTASGQLKNAEQLIVRGSAHFDLSLGFKANTWYAFGLPWRVNTNGGISVNGNPLAIDKNCLILEYNGAQRAAGKADPVMGCWNNVPADATLEPGRLYMIYLTTATQAVRFTKAPTTTLAPIVNTTIPVTAYSSSDSKNAGWNGIANPSTYYATLTTDGVIKGQKYIPGAPDAEGTPMDKYETFTLGSENLVVGQPLFVQVKDTKTLVADEKTNKFLAPHRATASEETLEYELRIAPANTEYTDRLYISAMDEKDDTYVIGQDLAKISVSRGVAQLWVERYDAKLSVNATELDSDNKATFPLGIYAPKAGNYDLSAVTSVPNDKELLLTYDGMPVKDLSTGTYTMTLQASTTRHYGLLLVHKAPQITTDGGMVETNSNNIRKVLIGGQVYIIRDGNIYSIFGQQIQ